MLLALTAAIPATTPGAAVSPGGVSSSAAADGRRRRGGIFPEEVEVELELDTESIALEVPLGGAIAAAVFEITPAELWSRFIGDLSDTFRLDAAAVVEAVPVPEV